MRSLGPITVLFVLLILVPAGILAILGWQSTDTFADQARQHASKESRDVAQRLVANIASAEKVITTQMAEILARAHGRITADIAEVPLESSLAAARRTLPHGASLGIVAGDGQPLLPRGPRSDEPRDLQEWPEFDARRRIADRLEFVDGDARAAGRHMMELGRDLGTNALKARAFAHAVTSLLRGGDTSGAQHARRELMSLPSRDCLAASPMIVEALLSDVAGREWLTIASERGQLLLTPARSEQRDRWTRVLAATETAPPPHSTLPGPAEKQEEKHIITMPLPAEMTLELTQPLTSLWSPIRRAMDETLGEFELRDAANETTIAVRWTALGRTRDSFLANPAFEQIDAEASNRRMLTAIGILILLLAMVAGMFLVRRALAREQAARTLRDDFIANVSHELRTPLTSIRMHADMLRDPSLAQRTREAYGEVIEAEGARLSSLVEDLLDFAALERGQRTLEPTPVDLGAASAATAAAWQPVAAHSGVTIHLDTPPDHEIAALADPTALSRILANLIQNALKHGRPTTEDLPARIELRVRSIAEDCVAIEVRDNGPGISGEDRLRIFDRFHQGEAARSIGGAGIGLALSRELARAMRGDLLLEQGQETTVFRLTLPAAPDLGDDLGDVA